MRSIIRRCFRGHTAAAAYTALFLAIGGTAYAASQVTGENIVDGSVKSADIGDYEVRGVDIGSSSVSSEKVSDNTLRSQDVQDGTLTGADLASGSVGSSELQVARSYATAEWQPDAAGSKTIATSCPTGQTAVSGGATLTGGTGQKPILRNIEPIDGGSWRASAYSLYPGLVSETWGLRIKVVCLAL